ncbi:hypothetical protein BH23ACT9_BH23ACT9_07590 [soil metagenome]
MNRTTLISIAAAIVVLVAVAGTTLYVNRPGVQEVSLEGTRDAVAVEAVPVSGDASGEWVVDTTIGEFDVLEATSSFVGFRVEENLLGVGDTEAVGRTPAVRGQMTVEGTTLTATAVEADFGQMVSDISRRDGVMRRVIGGEANPVGSFTLSGPVDFGSVPVEGETVTTTAVGNLTVNGITSPVEVALEAELVGDNILVVGRSPVLFADHGIEAPLLGPVVTIEDNGVIELQLWFTRA